MNMKVLFNFFSLLLVMYAGQIHADLNVFGPVEYIRKAGSPTTISDSFSVSDTNKEYTIEIINGPSERSRVSSAVVYLNGEVLIGPDELNQKIDFIAKKIKLENTNSLEVALGSIPDSSLMISFFGPDQPPSTLESLEVRPDGIPLNEEKHVTFTIDFPYNQNSSLPKVHLYEVTESNDVINLVGLMTDDGNMQNGDEAAFDGIFSFKKQFETSQLIEIRYRAIITFENQEIHSNIGLLDSYIPITEEEVFLINSALSKGEEVFNELIKSLPRLDAIDETVIFLKDQDMVKDAGVTEESESIWIIFSNEMQGIISTNSSGTRGGSRSFGDLTYSTDTASLKTSEIQGNAVIQSRNVLILSPFIEEFSPFDEGEQLSELYKNANCTAYNTKYLKGPEVDVEVFKTLGDYGMIHVASHGDTDKSKRVILLTKTPTTKSNMGKYQNDINKGRLVPRPQKGKGYLAITPSFISYYVKSMPGSLVFLSSCKSSLNDSMSSEFLGKGAAAYMGFSEDVPNNFAFNKATFFHKEWIEDPVNLVTTGDIHTLECTHNSDRTLVCWTLAGSETLEALSGQLCIAPEVSSTLLAEVQSGNDGYVFGFPCDTAECISKSKLVSSTFESYSDNIGFSIDGATANSTHKINCQLEPDDISLSTSGTVDGNSAIVYPFSDSPTLNYTALSHASAQGACLASLEAMTGDTLEISLNGAASASHSGFGRSIARVTLNIFIDGELEFSLSELAEPGQSISLNNLPDFNQVVEILGDAGEMHKIELVASVGASYAAAQTCGPDPTCMTTDAGAGSYDVILNITVRKPN